MCWYNIINYEYIISFYTLFNFSCNKLLCYDKLQYELKIGEDYCIMTIILNYIFISAVKWLIASKIKVLFT